MSAVHEHDDAKYRKARGSWYFHRIRERTWLDSTVLPASSVRQSADTVGVAVVELADVDVLKLDARHLERLLARLPGARVSLRRRVKAGGISFQSPTTAFATGFMSLAYFLVLPNGSSYSAYDVRLCF